MTTSTVEPGAWQEGIGKRYHPSLKPPYFSTACGFLVVSVELHTHLGKKYFAGYCWKACPKGQGILGRCHWHTNGLAMTEGQPDLKICEHLKGMLK